jgi:glycogen debranching enzyme
MIGGCGWLENQCWKDSWDAIAFADGSMSSTPRATCELQGYAYDAKLRTARLARDVWGDAAWADELERQAALLNKRFNTDYWVAGRGFFALGLDGQKRKIDSLTSNIGHLLWSGIVDDGKAQACAEHLMSDALFSGWGVRTMATTERGYNPIGYHVGTVWPHDNSIIAWGLRRYGFREEAARISQAMLEAAQIFGGDRRGRIERARGSAGRPVPTQDLQLDALLEHGSIRSALRESRARSSPPFSLELSHRGSESAKACCAATACRETEESPDGDRV